MNTTAWRIGMAWAYLFIIAALICGVLRAWDAGTYFAVFGGFQVTAMHLGRLR